MGAVLFYGLLFLLFFSDQLSVKGHTGWKRFIGVLLLVGVFAAFVCTGSIWLPALSALQSAGSLLDKICAVLVGLFVITAAYILGSSVAESGETA